MRKKTSERKSWCSSPSHLPSPRERCFGIVQSLTHPPAAGPDGRVASALALGGRAVRADRMRGGRNKFGPMYKRDRARKLQLMRQKQIARAQCQGVVGNEVSPVGPPSFSLPSLPSPSMYSNEPHIKQELIQIPQLSSSTSSPDSSPSPLCTSAQNNSTVAAHFALSVGGPHVLQQQQQQQEAIKVWPSHRAPSPPNSGTSSNGGRSAGSPKSPYHYGGRGRGGPVSSLAHTLFSGSGKVPHLIKEFQLSMPDDKEWQNQLYGLLQNQTYNQCEVDTFELMCKVIDQSLFAQVDWARNSVFFKELKVSPPPSCVCFCCLLDLGPLQILELLKFVYKTSSPINVCPS
ncbi:nuclear hormone receptor FTZ-F1 [Caerostris extrusa]|uniref:Nuclear hormone receptor FTZ-F1 n=1 Tax=Caerostris extrusa TaxID=172846 RepID=A0AAV4VNA0_CAEEX|nr:nuclear hormone receptor FTZ-F1 [Caerostris extrusa]